MVPAPQPVAKRSDETPGISWAGLIGVSALYGSMWLEARWVRDLLDRFGDVVTPRTHTAARSMLMTRMFIAALSIVVVAAEVGRLGQ